MSIRICLLGSPAPLSTMGLIALCQGGHGVMFFGSWLVLPKACCKEQISSREPDRTKAPQKVLNLKTKSEEEIPPPKKNPPKKESSFEQIYLNNVCWVCDSHHREAGKSSHELFEKVRVNAVFWGYFWILVGFRPLKKSYEKRH